MLQDMQSTNIPTILGVLGFLTYATADVLLSLRKLSSENCTYYVLCGFAALLLVSGLWFNFNLGAFLTEVFCLATCVLAIVLRARSPKPAPTHHAVLAQSRIQNHTALRTRRPEQRRRRQSGYTDFTLTSTPIR